MSIKVYVAGASKEADRCRAAMEYARELGCVITCDWLAEIERVGAANEGLSNEQRTESAIADLEGVIAADVFWLLAPENQSTGAWTELGYALALRDQQRRAGQTPIEVVVSGPGRARSIFSALADVELASDITAARHISAIAKARA